jgi:hypothetical protein
MIKQKIEREKKKNSKQNQQTVGFKKKHDIIYHSTNWSCTLHLLDQLQTIWRKSDKSSVKYMSTLDDIKNSPITISQKTSPHVIHYNKLEEFVEEK